jgi:23S rRNA pseudouridine1911/1915/1917 synthase
MHTRTFIVERNDAGRPLAGWLAVRLAVSRDAALRLVREGHVRVAGTAVSDPARRLRPAQRVEVRLPSAGLGRGRPGPRAVPHASRGEGGVRRTASTALVHVDEQVVVVAKPPGLTTMRHAEEAAEFGARGRRFLPPTLADLLPSLLAPGGGRPAVRAVHRLDKETSGLVVFARTAAAEADLGRQFRAHAIDRLYLALVRGRAREGRIESWLVRDRGDGRRGSGPPGLGQHAVTHVRVVEDLGEFTLVECRLETGRTHQVRIHLGEAATPLCGERVYDRPLHGRPLPDASGAPRVALHAAVLGFDHPATHERLRWTAPLPPDLAALLERLRRAARPPSR